MRILIADDDPVYRELLSGLLEEWAFEIVTVSDGAQALKALQDDSQFSIAVLDWMMPGMDGYEVCSRLRADERLEGLYVLIVTGSRKKEEILRVVVAGADDYLIKPFEPVDLKIRIRNAQRVLNLQEEVRNLKWSLLQGQDLLQAHHKHLGN